ncbi:MAG: hypothetical protein ABIG93_03080 [archaeon]|nr:hypothetical protein [Nanoarchaeota archaeon]
MTELTPLTLDEILSTNSIDELRGTYVDAGVKFKSEKKFLRQLGKDWKQLCKLEKKIASQNENIPETIPIVEINVDGVKCRLLGVGHALTGEHYKNIIRQTAWDEKNVVLEQGMRDFVSLGGPEMKDHLAAPGYTKYYVKGLIMGMGLPLYFLSKPLVSIGKRVSKRLDPSRLLEGLAITTLSLDPMISGGFRELPAHVEIELQEREERYEKRVRRSIYMAEFLKAWDVEGERSTVIGLGHVPEIVYFLHNGNKDEKSSELAREHVKILKKDRERYRNLDEMYMIKGALTIAAGFATPYAIGFSFNMMNGM